LVGDTQKVPRILQVEMSHSSNAADPTWRGQRLLFHGDLRLRNGVTELTSMPCGVVPQALSKVPAAMKVVGECYGVTGPNETRPPTRKCR
jgi:hypothetical protein